MWKFVAVMGAMKRGSGRSSLMTQSPSCSSCCERNAIEFPSGDQRGVEADHPDGNSVRGATRSSAHSRYGTVRGEGERGVGCAVGCTGTTSGSNRAIHSVLMVLSSATEDTV